MKEDGQLTIFDLVMPEQSQSRVKTEPTEVICTFSKHSCNKEELWKIAESLDDLLCRKVCCRKCQARLCGARCNGSEEPKAVEEEQLSYKTVPEEIKQLINELTWTRNESAMIWARQYLNNLVEGIEENQRKQAKPFEIDFDYLLWNMAEFIRDPAKKEYFLKKWDYRARWLHHEWDIYNHQWASESITPSSTHYKWLHRE